MKRITLGGSLLVIAVLVFGGSAYASSTACLQLTSGLTSVTVCDQTSLDTSPFLGVIAYSGSIGYWNINVTTGQTKPFLGDEPYMDLNTVDHSTRASSLTILFSDTGFVGHPLSATADIGGTTVGTVTYKTWYDPNNVLFARNPSYLLTSQTFSSGAFSGTASDFFGPISGPYSLTQEVTLTHGNKGNSSFNAELVDVPIPEPSEFLLIFIGLGVACMAGLISKV